MRDGCTRLILTVVSLFGRQLEVFSRQTGVLYTKARVQRDGTSWMVVAEAATLLIQNTTGVCYNVRYVCLDVPRMKSMFQRVG